MPYDIDYNDERFAGVEADKEQALNEVGNVYDSMINESDNYYQAQINASKDWANQQKELQQEQNDFVISEIQQQKEQAQKDYIKEQSGAYVDWQKQSNEYGANAEAEAMQGMSNTGYSESAQVSMYNTYQNRVATARESYSRAVLNYDNSIKEARLQNNSALAEIAYNALQKQLELSLQGFQYKNDLLLSKASMKLDIENNYYQRYQDVLNQINNENALAEEIRQFNLLHAPQSGGSGGGGGGGGGTPVIEGKGGKGNITTNTSENGNGSSLEGAWKDVVNKVQEAYNASNGSYTPSAKVNGIVKNLESMQGMIGSKDAIANSITVYAANGTISTRDAEYMYKHFGYNPDKYLE